MMVFTTSVGLFRYSVLPSFLEVCPHPERHSDDVLWLTYDLKKFLHCTTGPALVHLPSGYKEYYLFGEEVVDTATLAQLMRCERVGCH